jgi:hypothetical protein
MLANLLEDLKDEKATLAVQDPKLGVSIAQIPGLAIKTITDSSTQNLFRTIRENLTSLLPDLLPAEESATRLGLAHSLSRHKLKFSADKVDTMIIQSIASLGKSCLSLLTRAIANKCETFWTSNSTLTPCVSKNGMAGISQNSPRSSTTTSPYVTSMYELRVRQTLILYTNI